jgi:small subunit ribosomal protein S6
MAANVYECMFLLDPAKVAGDVPNAAKQLHAILERNNVEVLASRPWDERKLAYPIKGHKRGMYYLMYFRTEGKNLLNIERDLALNEMVVRQMVLRIDPKLVENMLAVARDEHALALQALPAESEGGEGGAPKPEGGEERPRRGGRRPVAAEEKG